MIKKIKKSHAVELQLVIKDDHFIRPPRDSQRNALINHAIKEFSNDLEALNRLAQRFVPGNIHFSLNDRTHLPLSDEDIMEDWQIPVMKEMVKVCTERKGDVLEIGFGRGIASELIQLQNVKSHTIIECNDSVIARFNKWQKDYKHRKIDLVHGLWQDTIESLGLFDGIFFHTYPLNEDEYFNYVNDSVTFAEHFFPVASKHLRDGGIFTYFSNEIDSLSRGHQRSLLKCFSSFVVHTIPLIIPEDVRDTWWADTMVIVKAIK